MNHAESATVDVDQLREQLRTHHTELVATSPEPGSSEYATAATAIIAATEALLEGEEIQARQEQELGRQHRVRHIRVVAGMASICAALTALTAVCGWQSRWWLTLAIPLVAITATAYVREAAAPARGQAQRQISAWMLAAAAAGTAVIMFTGLGLWIILAIATSVIGTLAYLDGLTPGDTDHHSNVTDPTT